MRWTGKGVLAAGLMVWIQSPDYTNWQERIHSWQLFLTSADASWHRSFCWYACRHAMFLCLFSLPISLSYTHERKKRRSNIGLWFENTILSSWSPLNKNYLPLYFCRQVILSFPFIWSCHLLLWLHPFFNLEGCLFLLLLY